MNSVKIKIPLSHTKMVSGGANFGIELSRWLQSQGLVREKDYTWSLGIDLKTVTFIFVAGQETYASLLALKWSGEQH